MLQLPSALVWALDLAVLAAFWTWALRGRMVRSWATVCCVLIVTAMYLLIALLAPPPWSLWRLLVVFASVWLLNANQHRFLALRPQDRQFQTAYMGLLSDTRVAVEQARSDPTSMADFPNAIRDIEDRLMALTPPDEAWANLRQEAIAYFSWLRAQYEAVGSGADGSAVAEAASGKQAALSSLYRRTMDQAYTFWQR